MSERTISGEVREALSEEVPQVMGKNQLLGDSGEREP